MIMESKTHFGRLLYGETNRGMLGLPGNEAAIGPTPAASATTVTAAPTPVRTAACFKCGLATIVPQLLTRVRVKRQWQLYCPRCFKARRALAALVSLLVIAMGITMPAVWLFNRRYMNRAPGLERFAELTLVTVLILAGLVVLHEFAHALAAWMVGFRVPEISIGLGPRIYRWRFRGTSVDIHAVPSSGWCRHAPRDISPARWRVACVIAAGPAMHLFFIGLLTFR